MNTHMQREEELKMMVQTEDKVSFLKKKTKSCGFEWEMGYN
jgi:hypothetical protein